jgi:hypothetical protein
MFSILKAGGRQCRPTARTSYSMSALAVKVSKSPADVGTAPDQAPDAAYRTSQRRINLGTAAEKRSRRQAPPIQCRPSPSKFPNPLPSPGNEPPLGCRPSAEEWRSGTLSDLSVPVNVGSGGGKRNRPWLRMPARLNLCTCIQPMSLIQK